MSKSTPDKKALDQALEIIKNIKTLIEFGALKFDREKRQVWIVKETFWDSKDDTWKANFCQNLKMYMDITWNADKHGPNLNPIHIYSIDIDTKTRKDYITTYLPDTKSLAVLAVRDLQSLPIAIGTDNKDL
jgi:hypothetical protein